MRYLVAILLLVGPVYASERDPMKCGRVVAARITQSALSGGGEVRMPKACPRVLIPPPFSVQQTSIGNVLTYPDGTVAATFLAPPQRTAVAPVGVSRRPNRRVREREPRAVAVDPAGFHRQTTTLNGRALQALVED